LGLTVVGVQAENLFSGETEMAVQVLDQRANTAESSAVQSIYAVWENSICLASISVHLDHGCAQALAAGAI
jgi:hypothetical protein